VKLFCDVVVARLLKGALEFCWYFFLWLCCSISISTWWHSTGKEAVRGSTSGGTSLPSGGWVDGGSSPSHTYRNFSTRHSGFTWHWRSHYQPKVCTQYPHTVVTHDKEPVCYFYDLPEVYEVSPASWMDPVSSSAGVKTPAQTESSTQMKAVVISDGKAWATSCHSSVIQPSVIFHWSCLCPTQPVSHTHLVRSLHSPVHTAASHHMQSAQHIVTSSTLTPLPDCSLPCKSFQRSPACPGFPCPLVIQPSLPSLTKNFGSPLLIPVCRFLNHLPVCQSLSKTLNFLPLSSESFVQQLSPYTTRYTSSHYTFSLHSVLIMGTSVQSNVEY